MAWWPAIGQGEGLNLSVPSEPGRPRRIGSVLCALDRRACEGGVLDVAIESAEHNDARLTLMAVARPPHPMVAIAGQTSEQLFASVEREVLGWLAAALDAVPSDIEVSAVLRVGRTVPTILAEAAAGDPT